MLSDGINYPRMADEFTVLRIYTSRHHLVQFYQKQTKNALMSVVYTYAYDVATQYLFNFRTLTSSNIFLVALARLPTS